MSEAELKRRRNATMMMQQQLLDLQDELRTKDEIMYKLEEQISQMSNKVKKADQKSLTWDKDMETRVKTALKDNETKIEELNKALQEKDETLKDTRNRLDQANDQINTLQGEIMFYKKQIQQFAGKYELKDALSDLKKYRDELANKENEFIEVNKQWNEVSRKCEDLIAENLFLREKANVPKDNYGVNLEEIKLANRAKDVDYKTKALNLEQEVEELEKERARLRANLRRLTLLKPSEGYKDLSDEQTRLLNEYYLNLLNGTGSTPHDAIELRRENEKLKAQIQILKEQKFDGIEEKLEKIMEKKGFGQMTMEAFNQLNAEVKQMQKTSPEMILESKVSLKGAPNKYHQSQFRLSTSPIPIEEATGEIKAGKSVRFDRILTMPVDVNTLTKEDYAFLQLQNIECVAILEKKEGELSALSSQIEYLNQKIRDASLVQEELFKRFVQFREATHMNIKEITDKLRDRDSALEIEKKKVAVYEMNNELEIKTKLSIAEGNVIKLSNRYMVLETQYNILSDAYHSIEKDYLSKSETLENNIKSLREWKSRAICEMRYLYDKLRDSIPMVEFEHQVGLLNIAKQREAAAIVKNGEITKRLLGYSNIKSQLADKDVQLKEKEDDYYELERELERTKGMLENIDRNYAHSQAVMGKLLLQLRNVQVPPNQAFEVFDPKRAGKISVSEFASAIISMKVDITMDEAKCIVPLLERDVDGMVIYQSFINQIKRTGLKIRSLEEQALFAISDTIKKNNLSLEEAFKIMDKSGKGVMTKEDIADAFRQMKIGLTEQDISRVINHLYPSNETNIDYKRFVQAFAKTSLKIQREEDINNKVKMNWRAIKFAEIDEASKKARTTIKQCVKEYGTTINVQQFTEILFKLGVEVEEEEGGIQALFNFLDAHKLGSITSIELEAEIQKSIGRRDSIKLTESLKFNEELSANKKLQMMEERESQAIKKYHREAEKNGHLKLQYEELESELQELQKTIDSTREKNLLLQQESVENEKVIAQSITKDRFIDQIQKLESTEKELGETKEALNSYKNLYESSGIQLRALKLAMERKNDEVLQYRRDKRELQQSSDANKVIGHLQFIVMLSRWQEAHALNKYEISLIDNKALRTSTYSLQRHLENYEAQIKQTETKIYMQNEKIAKLESKLVKTDNPFATQEKLEELNSTNMQLLNRCDEIEDNLIALKHEKVTILCQLDEACVRRERSEQLYTTLRLQLGENEMSQKLTDLTNTISFLRISELKANREIGLLKEKEIYLQKINANQTHSLSKQEQDIACIEKQLRSKEEEFRKKDNDRQKIFFELQNKAKTGEAKDQRPMTTADMSVSKISKYESSETQSRLIKDYEAKIAELTRELNSKNKVINAWKIEDSNLTPDQQKLVAQVRQSVTAEKDEEARQMTEAIYKTVKTIKQLNDDLKEQLKQKEMQVNNLREDMRRQKEIDSNEIANLNLQLLGVGKQAIGKLINLTKTVGPSDNVINQNIMVSQNQIEIALAEKDKVINQLKIQLEGKVKELELTYTKLNQQREENLTIRTNYEDERKKYDASTVSKELKIVKDTLKKKEKELENTKDAIKEIKNNLMEHVDQIKKQEDDVNAQALKERSIKSENEYKIRQATEAIEESRRLQKLSNNELKAVKEQIKEKDKEITSLKDQLQKAKNEVLNAKYIPPQEAPKKKAKAKESEPLPMYRQKEEEALPAYKQEGPSPVYQEQLKKEDSQGKKQELSKSMSSSKKQAKKKDEKKKEEKKKEEAKKEEADYSLEERKQAEFKRLSIKQEELSKTVDENKSIISNLQNKIKVQTEEISNLRKEIIEITTQRDFFKKEGERYQRMSQDIESAIGIKLESGIAKTMEMESKPLIQIKDEQIKVLNKEIETLKEISNQVELKDDNVNKDLRKKIIELTQKHKLSEIIKVNSCLKYLKTDLNFNPIITDLDYNQKVEKIDLT